MNILIVDMLNGFTTEGALASPRIESLIEKQVDFIRNIPLESHIIFVGDAHNKDDPEFKTMPPHCIQGTSEAEICPKLLKISSERNLDFSYYQKTTFSAFYKTSLRYNEYIKKEKKWIVIGCVTDICITQNIAELSYRNKEIIVPKDLVDTYDIPNIHDAETINEIFFNTILPKTYGAKIVTSDEITNND